MTDEDRQRLNVRTIRVSLSSALGYAGPDDALRCKSRAEELLAVARGETTLPAVIAEIEAMQAELASDSLGQQVGER